MVNKKGRNHNSCLFFVCPALTRMLKLPGIILIKCFYEIIYIIIDENREPLRHQLILKIMNGMHFMFENGR